MCRYGCQQLSKIKPVLEAQNIKLIAIGMEESLDDFVEGMSVNPNRHSPVLSGE
jgi:hypothetical protein